jgi:alkylated DNA repair dioxygenase AlkB
MYSGTPHQPLPWTPALELVRERVLGLTGCAFNSVLLNLYRDGRDGMGWHSDDEPELGRDPVIASVSLGAPRRFCLRHRRRKDQRLDVSLGPGSLLLMAGATQHHWVHAVPKTALPVGPRVNLTFRQILR